MPCRHVAALATAVAVALGAACSTPAPTLPPGHARVIRAVDGDTLVVDLAGEEHTVRLLGIDTPETHHPRRPLECHGPEAAARLAELAPPGTEVRLERDVEVLDTYGRLLAHVVRQPDGLRLGLAMAAEGHADALRIPPNTARSGEVAAAVADARSAGRGLWAHCEGPHVPAEP